MTFLGLFGGDLYTVPMFLIGIGVSIIEFLYVLTCLILNKPYDKCLSITAIEKKTIKQPHKTFLGVLRLVLNGLVVFLMVAFYVYYDSPIHWFLFLFCFLLSLCVWGLLSYFNESKN